MKKKSKNILTIIIIVISVAILVTGGIYAYLTDTDTATNVFTKGSVKISLTEPSWNPSNALNLRPGNTVSKDPQINNIGKNDAYVYIKVEQPNVVLANEAKGPLFSYTTNNGWTLLGDNSSQTDCPVRTSVYYYNTALAKNTSTSKLFNNVTVNNFSQNYINNLSVYFDITDMDMNITGYAIQTRNIPSGTTIQNAYNTYFENSGIEECESLSTIYRWSENALRIGQDISSLTLGTDYVTDKSQLTNMNALASKFFLKHSIYNNKVFKIFVCFNVTSEMVSANPTMTAGEYCLDSSNTAYETNKSIATTAFGASKCSENDDNFYCSIPGFGVSIGTFFVSVNDDSFSCFATNSTAVRQAASPSNSRCEEYS